MLVCWWFGIVGIDVIVFWVFLELGFFFESLVILDSWRLFVVFYVLYIFNFFSREDIFVYEVGCFFVIDDEVLIFLNVEGRDLEGLNFFDKDLVGYVIVVMGEDMLGFINFCIEFFVMCGIVEGNVVGLDRRDWLNNFIF